MNRHERRAQESKMRKAWDNESYTALEPGDLDPTPPTAERRVRVAAMLATMMRDRAMGLRSADSMPDVNGEMIRAILVMDDEAWARDIGGLQEQIREHLFDAVPPLERFKQIQAAFAQAAQN